MEAAQGLSFTRGVMRCLSILWWGGGGGGQHLRKHGCWIVLVPPGLELSPRFPSRRTTVLVPELLCWLSRWFVFSKLGRGAWDILSCEENYDMGRPLRPRF